MQTRYNSFEEIEFRQAPVHGVVLPKEEYTKLVNTANLNIAEINKRAREIYDKAKDHGELVIKFSSDSGCDYNAVTLQDIDLYYYASYPEHNMTSEMRENIEYNIIAPIKKAWKQYYGDHNERLIWFRKEREKLIQRREYLKYGMWIYAALMLIEIFKVFF